MASITFTVIQKLIDTMSWYISLLYFYIWNDLKLLKHAIWAILISVEVDEIQLNFIEFCRGISILQ